MFQFNFVGKLLGPKGNSLKRLQEETMTKMAILGRGSMRDKQKVSTTSHASFIIRPAPFAGTRPTGIYIDEERAY
jgi:KH domain